MYFNEMSHDAQLQLEQLFKMAARNPVSVVNLVPHEKGQSTEIHTG